MSERESVIATSGLVKRFGRFTAVDGIDLDVRAGDVYGFLGANGSGKTTTVRMLLGLVLATSGSITVLGREVPRHAKAMLPEVGALVESPAAYGHLSGRENLALFDAMAATRGLAPRRERVEQALERVGLGGIDRRPVRAYSLGMRQRLGLAGALLRGPRLLVLDEPTNGLDPQGIQEIRDLVLRLARGGTTVFLSSHLLAEVEQMCTRVGVLDGGRLVLQGDLAALTGPTGRVVVDTADVERARDLLGGAVEEGGAAGLVVRTDDPTSLVTRLVEAGVGVRALTPERRTLEQVVLAAARGSADRFERVGGAA